jgi:hypothetical protein
MPPAARNLFEKRFLDFKKLFKKVLRTISKASLPEPPNQVTTFEVD